jgi:hypothetical protein
MKRYGMILLAILLLSAGSAVPAQAVGDCPGRTAFAESQAWWKPKPGTTGGKNFGHVHVGACIPERDTLSADTTIPVTVILHENPGTLQDISLVFKTDESETTVAKVAPGFRTCRATETCSTTVNMPIDISKFDRSGLQEIRFRVYVEEPDGNIMHSSLTFQTTIRNGKTASDVSRMPYLRSKGWYTDYGYCEADVLSVPIPDEPISGVWNVTLQQADHGEEGDVAPSHHSVRLDANAHHGIAGTVLTDGPGPLAERTFAIDTRELSNGTHRLVQRVDCARDNQVNSGVSVLRFTVRN